MSVITDEEMGDYRRKAALHAFPHSVDGKGMRIESDPFVGTVLGHLFAHRPQSIDEAIGWSDKYAGSIVLGIQLPENMEEIGKIDNRRRLEFPTRERLEDLVVELSAGRPVATDALMLEALVMAISHIGGSVVEDGEPGTAQLATEQLVEAVIDLPVSKAHIAAFKIWWNRANLTLLGLREAAHGFDKERSDRFIRRAATYRRSYSKISRNDPCPCESGKKFKRCCGR